MVVDASAILAIVFDETHTRWAQATLAEHAGALVMSTVNLTEVLILVGDRSPDDLADVRRELLSSGIRFVSPDVRQAQLAAELRLAHRRLNLGDCFACALSTVEECGIITLDADFESADRPVVMPERAG